MADTTRRNTDLWDMPRNESLDLMFRTMQANHLSLVQIADHKASILVGASTVSLGVITPIGSDAPVSLIVLALTAASAAAAGVLALIPRRHNGGTGHRNLLFFGVHSRLESDAYHREMANLAQTPGGVSEAIVEDVHQTGQVLARKFKLVDVAYRILFVGLPLTAVTFAFGW